MKTLLSIVPFIFMMGMLNAQSIIHVPADQPTIQAGVDDASDTDTVLVADGTYTGDGNSEISLGGKAITVKSENGAPSCIMDGEGDGYFGFADGISYDGVDARVEGFTIRNCKGPGFYYYAGSGPDIVGNIVDSCSGGIIVTGGDQSLIENNMIYSNTSSGIELSNFNGTVASNIIRSNTTGSGSGGGLELYRSKAIVMNNLISDNAAKNFGGGIYVNEDTSLYINNTITNNSARTGAGMYAYKSSPILVNNLVAYSELYLFPEDDKFTQSGGITTSYIYNGGVLAAASISATFINQGAACDVTVHVVGLDKDTVFAAGTYERFGLRISCGIGGSSQVSTEVSSATDTLIITAHNSEINLTPASFSVTSGGYEEYPGAGLVATESENIGVRNNLFFENTGGDLLKGNSEDGYVEENIVGVNGNLTSDPLLHESTKVPLAGSPCIDYGTTETEGVLLPETDVYGQDRFMDGDSDKSYEIDLGACEYEYVHVPVVGIPENETEDGTTLHVFPNPFSELAHIQFTLAESSQVTLELYDCLGRKVASLLNDQMSSGDHTVDFNGRALSSGIYFFRLQSDEFVIERKVLLHR